MRMLGWVRVIPGKLEMRGVIGVLRSATVDESSFAVDFGVESEVFLVEDDEFVAFQEFVVVVGLDAELRQGQAMVQSDAFVAWHCPNHLNFLLRLATVRRELWQTGQTSNGPEPIASIGN